MRSLNKIKAWINDDTTVSIPNYVPAFDIINVFACIAVVSLHVNGSFWNFSYNKSWVLANIIENLFYWAVPVFFMVSGATLIDYRKRYSTIEFIKKRFSKTFIPFIAWSFIVVIRVAIRDINSILINGHFSVLKIFDIIFNTTDLYFYWFFIALFALYSAIPVISLIPHNYRKKTYLYMIALALLTLSILPLLCNLLGINMNNHLKTPISAGYMIYILLGYCLTRYQLGKKVRFMLYFLGFLGFLAQLLGTHYMSYKSGSLDETFKGYLNLPCVLFSVAVFVWFFYNKSFTSNIKAVKVFKFLSGASFGIYLSHFYVQNLITLFLQYFFDIYWDQTTLSWRLFAIPSVYLGSFITTLIIKKIPILKRIIP